MSSLQAPSAFWGRFPDLHVEAAYIVTGCALKRGAQVQVEAIDGQVYVRMDKSVRRMESAAAAASALADDPMQDLEETWDLGASAGAVLLPH